MSSSKTIGIIGGGQLGQMMAISAIYMGHKVIALDPAADCPASRVAEIIVAPYNDVDALRQLAERCDVLTYEFENVDADGLDAVIKDGQLPQGTDLLRISQNRIFEKDFLTAQRESANAFSDDAMYLEKLILEPRHVEVQIMGDNFGNVVALGERDCSIQRNHQKLVEESPSPIVSPETREKMMKAAVKAAKSVQYTGAGTIEFIMDKSGEFYFMEMNTRIQVEHGVTELLTNTDLVMEQIRVAAGEPLSLKQEEIPFLGHSIECRINAEIPEKNFMPSPGKITALHLPGGNGVRVDTALYTGYSIPMEYDSMIAKVLVLGRDRNEAIRKMKVALEEMLVLGVETNLDFQYKIMQSEAFREGKVDTGFVERFMLSGK